MTSYLVTTIVIKTGATMAATTTVSIDIPKQLIRASVQGVVYLIDSPTGNVYTYNLKNPTYIGKLEKIPEEDKHMISKTNGCLANARVVYRNDIYQVMKELRTNPDKKLSHVISTYVCA